MVDFLLSAVSSSCCWGVGQRGMATVSCVVLVVVVRGRTYAVYSETLFYFKLWVILRLEYRFTWIIF